MTLEESREIIPLMESMIGQIEMMLNSQLMKMKLTEKIESIFMLRKKYRD